MMSFLEICDSTFMCNGVNLTALVTVSVATIAHARNKIVRSARAEAETSVQYNSTAQLELVHFHSAMDSRFVFALSLLCSLQVDCETPPYVSFSMGAGLPNNSYVDLETVGLSDSNSVWCNTDLMTCCRKEDGLHRGQWVFPNGALQANEDIYVVEEQRRVELRRANGATSPTGIYRCEIPTNAVHDDTDISVRATVYVGLYTSAGNYLLAKCIMKKV